MIELLFHCPEPKGARLRRVRELERTPQQIQWVMEKMSGVPSFFMGQSCWSSIDELYDDKKVFFLVDDVGIICVAPNRVEIMPNAHVHITFWDGRLRGREGLCRGLAREVLNAYSLSYLWTAIPDSSKMILAFAKRVGFKESRRFGPTVVLELTGGAFYGT